MSLEQAQESDVTGLLQVLTFDMQGETFAIEANMVREIVDHMPETSVPTAPAMVSGLANFRGRVIPLADLHHEFGFAAAGSTLDSRVIVIELVLDGEATLVGLKADKVHEVTLLELASTEAPPRVGMRWRPDFIRCIAKRAGDFIIVPDLERIFATCSGTDAPAVQSFTQH
jgi:purine-binding chemotaxis protein CheW